MRKKKKSTKRLLYKRKNVVGIFHRASTPFKERVIGTFTLT